jgi:hypothetical protein
MPTAKVTSVEERIDAFCHRNLAPPSRAEEADSAYIYLFRICVWFRVAQTGTKFRITEVGQYLADYRLRGGPVFRGHDVYQSEDRAL